MDKICESNNDCMDNEFCDPQIEICVCSNGLQFDDTKKFCSSSTGTVGLNISSYDLEEVNNVIPEQQQLDTHKEVNEK